MFRQRQVFCIHLDYAQCRNGIRGLLMCFCQFGWKLIEQKEISLPLFIFIKQMNSPQSFFQVIHHIVIQIGFQHIFNRRSEFLFYVK